MEAFYPVLGWWAFSAELPYTTTARARPWPCTERPARLAWGRRPGAGGSQVPRAGHPSGRLSPATARRDRALHGDRPADVKHPPPADARGDGPERRAAGRCAWLTQALRVVRGVSQGPLPGAVGCLQCLRPWRPHQAWEPAARRVQVPRDPARARRARQGACVRGF